MERNLLWSTFIIGCAGWLGTVLLTLSRRPRGEKAIGLPFLVIAVLLPLVVYVVTLPDKPPFGVGQGWGRGFVIGSVGSLLATWVLMQARAALADVRRRSLRPAAAVAAPLFLALVAVATPLLFMRATIIDALVGVAMGWFCVSFVLFLGLAGTSISHYLSVVAGIGFTVTLCAVTALGIYREPITPGIARGAWSTLAMLLACGVPLSLLLSALMVRVLVRPASGNPINRLFAGVGRRYFPDTDSDALAGRGYGIVLCGVLLLALGNVLSLKLIEEPRLFSVILLGVLTGLVTWWLAHESRPATAATEETMMPGSLSPLAALVMLCAFMVSYQLLQGFGAGLMLLAAWMSLALALPGALQDEGDYAESAVVPQFWSTPLALSRVLMFATVLLLYRVFSMRFRDDLHGVALTDHYALFGFLAGAMTPGLLAGLLWSPVLVLAEGKNLAGARLGRLLLVAVLALAVPAAILVLWGAKCALALLAGLALATVGGHLPSVSARRAAEMLPRAIMATSLFAVAIALALVQWTHRVLPVAEMTRADRIRVLAGVVGALLILLLIADYGGRLIDWAQRRRQTSGTG
jgi:hypothetical protein